MTETALRIAAGSRWSFGLGGSIYEVLKEPEKGDRYVVAKVVGSTGEILAGTPRVELRLASFGTAFLPALLPGSEG